MKFFAKKVVWGDGNGKMAILRMKQMKFLGKFSVLTRVLKTLYGKNQL